MTGYKDTYDPEENYFPEADLIVTMADCEHFSEIEKYIEDPDEDTINKFLDLTLRGIVNLSPMQLIIYTLSLAGEMPPKYRKQLMRDARAAHIHAQILADAKSLGSDTRRG